MKTQLLFALAALTPCLCDESSATFPKPLILNFYQKDKGSTVFSDVTQYQNGTKSVDDGVSPKAEDPAYLKHFKFTSADGPERTFYWQPEGKKSINCNVVVSGDPKTEQLVYNVDLRTFEHEGEPDLSVVHIHCPEDPGAIDDSSSGQNSSNSGDHPDQTLRMSDQQYVDVMDQGTWFSNEEEYESRFPGPSPPSPQDTDFEHELNVIFQISDQPRYFNTKEEAKEKKSQLNMDFLWSAIGDQNMTQEEVDYEKYQAGSAERSYRQAWIQANNSDTPSGTFEDVPYGASYGFRAAHYGYVPPQNSYLWGGPWFGEVGRMVIWRAQTAPRDFMWTLNDEVETSEVVEKIHVEKRDGDVKKTKARKCHFKASYDPHVKVVYVILDGDEPKIKLDANNLGEKSWNGQGDEKAFEVTCDKVIEDLGPEPDIATTRISTESPSSAQPTEAKSTGDAKEGESKTETKDGEPTSSAAT